MKKIKILLTVITLTFCVQKASSQAAILALLFGDKVASEEFNLSLELGWNFSNISDFSDGKKSYATNFGLGCNLKLSEKFYVSPTAYFLSQRKLNFKDLSPTTGNDVIDMQFANSEGSSNLNYIDVPVIFWYQMKKIRIGLGPQVSFLTSSDMVFKDADGQFTQNIKNDTNKIDYGVMASLSYELGKARKGRGIFCQLRYYHGFEDVYKDQISTGSNTLNYLAVHFSLPFITDALAKKHLEELDKY